MDAIETTHALLDITEARLAEARERFAWLRDEEPPRVVGFSGSPSWAFGSATSQTR